MRTQVRVKLLEFGAHSWIPKYLLFKLTIGLAILSFVPTELSLYAQSCNQNPSFTCSTGNPVCASCSWSCPSGGTACLLPPSQYVCSGNPTGHPACGGSGWYCAPGPSPIIIDTTGKGFHLTSAAHGVIFDMSGTGHPMQMSWTDPASGNAFLALDRDGNGNIDNGTELFGNFTKQAQ